ncbi:hypothetical protein BH24ACT5_BH24ACT5_31180 [soil metagenome]
MAALALGLTTATANTTVPPTVPPATTVATTIAGPPATAVDTSLLRDIEEDAAAKYFVELTGGAVTQVACAPPPADEGGVQFVCFALDAGGVVVAAQATVDDYGTPIFDPMAVPDPCAVTSTTVSDVLGTYTATGPQLVSVEAVTGPHVVVLAHTGVAAFAVQPVSNGADAGSPLVSAAGAFTGRTVLNVSGGVDGFRVTADGDWTLEILVATTALSLAPGATVSGDHTDVVSWTGPSPVTATYSYAGTTPFSIVAVAPGGNTSLAAGAGALDGTVAIPAGPSYLQVTADGPWTITAP